MAQWVTVGDYITATGAPIDTYTQGDIDFIRQCCNAVSAFVTDARPELIPPPPELTEDGLEIIAMQNIADGAPEASAAWASIQLVKKWYEKRGAANVTGYAELGFVPSAVRDYDIAAALSIGVNSKPIAM